MSRNEKQFSFIRVVLTNSSVVLVFTCADPRGYTPNFGVTGGLEKKKMECEPGERVYREREQNISAIFV